MTQIPLKSQSLFQQMVFCNRLLWLSFMRQTRSQSLFQQMVFCNLLKVMFYMTKKLSQSLFQQMVFCNSGTKVIKASLKQSQSLFQQMVFCNYQWKKGKNTDSLVTILILVDGFLQSCKEHTYVLYHEGHNPYFSRWFSAIKYNDRKNKSDRSQSLFQQMVFCNKKSYDMML